MRAKDMRSNDGCCNNVPIRFASAKEMFEYLQDVGDLYSPDERIYVFNYSESGALAVYRICELRAKELSRDSKKADEYWGAFLGPGGSIYDVPGEQCGVDYAMKFCEDWYKSEWYDTRDYAEILKKENERNV